MQRRQPLPRLWLMTDERQGEDLWRALERLPRGAAIVFRHYGLPTDERRRMLLKIAEIANRRRLVLVVAAPAKLGRCRAIEGFHNSRAPQPLISTASAHSLAEIRKAERAGADLVFLSPAFPTRSHPGARALGTLRFRLLARQSRLPVIALGGMDAGRARRLNGAIYGWAGIDAWA